MPVFLNPWLLLGIPAASIPIIIHLAQRRKFKVVQWGAMNFLLLSEAKTTRKRKIQNLILLILRTLMILLIVLAASRPLLKGIDFAGSMGKESTHAIIILDDSFSMGATPGDGAATSFDRAKKAAEEIMSFLRPGDAVSVIRASDPPRDMGNPNYTPQVVKQEVVNMKISTHGTNYVGAFAVANQALDRTSLPRKEVYVIGDCQVEGWKRGAGGEGDPFTEVSQKAKVYVVKIPPVSDQNAAITAVEFPRGLVDTLGPTRIMGTVRNFGNSDLHHVTAKLVINDTVIDSRTIAVKAKTEEPVDFRYPFGKAGLHAGYLELSTDVLEMDNRAYFHAYVRDQAKVLVIDGLDDRDGSSRFLQVALNPTGKGFMTVKAIPVTQLGSHIDQLHEYHVVMLAGVGRLSSHDIGKLEQYIKQGGSVFMGLGESLDQVSYNEALYRRGEGMFPGRLAEVKGDAKVKKTKFFPVAFKQDHALLKIFSDLEITDLKSCAVYQYYRMEVAQDPTVTSVVSFQDGSPLLVEKQYGKGKVVVWNTSLDDSWNDLPTIQHLMYLPLMNQIAAYLAGGRSEPLLVGHPILKKMSFREYPFQGQMPIIMNPEKEMAQATTTSDNEGYEVRFDKTEIPGSYALTRQGGVPVLDRFSVNVDTRESNLDAMDETRLRALFPEATFRFLDNEAGVRTLVEKERIGVELWKPILKLLFLIGLVEFILAHMFSHQLRAQPSRPIA